MHYVCIEDSKVTSILNYEPNVPVSVTKVGISDEQYQQLVDQTHTFDVSSLSLIPVPETVAATLEQEKLNAVEREFLNSTDWKVLRHIRQKALGKATTLTEAEYLALETQREAAAARIV